MSKKQLTILLDKLGVCTSVLCMIHCLAMPLFVVFGFDSMLMLVEQEWVEWTLIALALVIGLASFSGGYLKHRRHYVPILFLAGFLLIVNGEMLHGNIMGLILPLFGAGIIIYAHLQNLVLKQRIKLSTSQAER